MRNTSNSLISSSLNLRVNRRSRNGDLLHFRLFKFINHVIIYNIVLGRIVLLIREERDFDAILDYRRF